MTTPSFRIPIDGQAHIRPYQRGRRRSRVKLLIGVSVPVAALLLAGLLTSRHTVPTAGGTISVDFHSPSNYVNPLRASTDTDEAISQLLFPGLLKWSPSGQLEGDLASKWTMTGGGTQIDVTLRPDLRWQTGLPVTAADVVWTYRLLSTPSFPTFDSAFRGVSLQAPTGRAIVFTLPRANYTFPSQLTQGIVPSGFAHSTTPVGSGPYAFARATSDSMALRSDNPDNFIGGVAVVTGSAAPPAGLSCSESIGVGSFGPNQPNSAELSIPVTRLAGLTINVDALPQRLVRLALLSAVRTKLGQQLVSPLPDWLQINNPAAFPNRLSASRLLDMAGWKRVNGSWVRNGKTLQVVLAAAAGSSETHWVRTIRAAWTALGLQVTTVRPAFPNFVRTVLYPGAYSAAITEWDFQGPDYDPAVLWSAHAALNFAHIRDPKLDHLVGLVRFTPSSSKRATLRREAGARLIRDGVAIGLQPVYYDCEISSSIHGFIPPTLVTNAGGVIEPIVDSYLDTKTEFRTPF